MFTLSAIKEVSRLGKEFIEESITIQDEIVEGLGDLFRGNICFWRRKGRGRRGNIKKPYVEKKGRKIRINPPDRPLNLKTSYFKLAHWKSPEDRQNGDIEAAVFVPEGIIPNRELWTPVGGGRVFGGGTSKKRSKKRTLR